jgi:sugar lactone lactonase YvrE
MQHRILGFVVVFVMCSLVVAAKVSIVLEASSFPPEMKDEVEQVAAAYKEYPDEAAVLYQVAALHARAGHREQALESLRKMAAVGAGLDPRSRSFGELAKDKEFLKIKGEIQKANPAVITARLAYTIGEGDLMPEGIAYSEKTRKLYLGSFRKIVSVAEDGTYEHFVAPKTGGLGVVLGIRVDDQRGELWAVSSAIGEKTPDMVLGLFRFRLANGELIKAYPIEDADKTMLNDIAIGKDGSAYATASISGALWRVDPSGKLEKFLPDRSLPDPNGIVATPDGKYLLVAGWYGITRVDLRNKKTLLLEKPRNVADGCLDGMYLHNQIYIIGVQNCVHETGRIMRYKTSFDWSVITNAQVLESYNPMFDGITTAAIAGDQLYFQANTQFRKFGKPGEKFDPVKIVRVSLK